MKYAYDLAGNVQTHSNNLLIQAFSVNVLNQLSNVTRVGTGTNALTVAGTTGARATSVTVNGTSATLFKDGTFASAGFTVTNGQNSFTAVAADSLGRSSTDTVTMDLPSPVNFTYDGNGNMTSDGLRRFDYDDDHDSRSERL